MKMLLKICSSGLSCSLIISLIFLPCVMSLPANAFASEKFYGGAEKELKGAIEESMALISEEKRAGPLDQEPPVIIHEPVQTAGKQDIQIFATIEDGTEVHSATLYYRVKGNVSFESIKMRKIEENTYVGIIPDKGVSFAGMEYFIEASDLNNNIATDGSKEVVYPIMVKLEQGQLEEKPGKKPIYKKWWFWSLALATIAGGALGAGGGGNSGGSNGGGGDDGETGTIKGSW